MDMTPPTNQEMDMTPPMDQEMDMTPPTDQEMEHYSDVFFTSHMPWDRS